VRAHEAGYWREVVRSGEYTRLGVSTVKVYGHFQSVFFLILCAGFLVFLMVPPSDCIVASFGRLERSWFAGCSWGITYRQARVCHRTAGHAVEFGRPTRPSESLPPRLCLVKFDIRFYSRLSFGFVNNKRNALLTMYEYRFSASKPRLVFKGSSWGVPEYKHLVCQEGRCDPY
jgi:hypothetical protein